MFQSHWNKWYNHECPFCESINWTFHGHSNDKPFWFPHACKCYKCNQKYWLMHDYVKEEYFQDRTIDDDSIIFQDGLEIPLIEKNTEYYT